MPDKLTDEQKSKHAKKTLEILAQERLDYEPMMDEVIRFVNHSRRLISDDGGRSGRSGSSKFSGRKGNKTGGDIYDGTALGAAALASDGIFGNMIPPNRRWFKLQLPGNLNFSRTSGARALNRTPLGDVKEVKEWLQASEDVLLFAYLLVK